MSSVAAALAYAGFICVGLACVLYARVAGTERDRQRHVNVLISYVLAVSCLAGLTRRDLWPFSAWQLMVGDAPAAIGAAPDPESLRIRGVDLSGVEHAIDYRAWQPLSVEDLSRWLISSFEELDPSEQEEVAGYLLQKANEGRVQALAGHIPGTFDRWFGRVSAPYHLLHPRRWDSPESVPDGPFVAVRLYRESYELEALRRGSPMRLDLLYEYVQSPP